MTVFRLRMPVLNVMLLLLTVFVTLSHGADSFVSSPARPDRQVTSLTLPNLFSDRMVLQRDMPIRVWGWARPGDEVTVRFADQAKTTLTSSKGAWQLLLDPEPASFEDRRITVRAGRREIVVKDVLVGEVWLCGGQSNMEWDLRGSLEADVEIASADTPAMRYIRLPKVASTHAKADFLVDSRPNGEGRWYACQPEHVTDCTAVGYYFGRRLHRLLRVPVGLIDTSWGGTMAQHWVTRNRLETIPEMTPYFDQFAAQMKAWKDGGGAAGAQADYKKAMTEYEAAVAALKQGDSRPRRPSLRNDPATQRQPAGMINGVIAPISGYSLKGVLFYQGENNSFGESWKPFYRTFPAVIESFRQSFGNPDLPFGIIQIAGWSNRRTMSYDMNHHCNVIREIQFDVWQRTANSGLIVSFDLNVNGSIHPRCKMPVGERSARWALAEVYNVTDHRNQPLAWRGPMFEKMTVEDGKCVLQFDKRYSQGLLIDKEVPSGFYMAGEDRVFHDDVQVRVNAKDMALTVWSDSVKAPVAVRYAQSNLPIGGLMNGHELPAYPFRTDDWPITPHQSKGDYIRSQASIPLVVPKRLVETRNPPTEIVKKGSGHYFVAFEKHAFGTIELEITSPRNARVVEVHFAEKLSGKNTIDRKPPGTIRYRKAEVKLKKGTHTYRIQVPPDARNTKPVAIAMPPHIGEVIPFRYCEIIECPSPVTADGIRQVAAHTPFDEDASSFISSDETLNQIWDLCKYSIKATSFCGVYVDGDRERIPYEADAYLNQLCHYCVDDEYGMARVTQKHFIEHPTWPTEWLLHSPLMAWAEYMYTGDLAFSREYYEDLKVRVLVDLAREDGLISTATGLASKELLAALNLEKPPRDLVDWPPASFTRGQKYGERDKYEMVAVNTVVNAFHYRALVVIAEIADLLDKDQDARMFSDRAKKVYASFNRVFWDSKKGVYVDGEGSKHAALHANMFPLALGLVPEQRKASVVKHIESRGMACSVYGAQYLLEGLYEAGQDQYALALMTAKHDRSWWNMIEVGSTVTLEAWDWKYKNNLDWNHAWGAVPANIIPRYLMGVRPLTPGFGKVLINPQPGDLKKASVTVPTPRGAVHVAFENTKDKPFKLTVMVPQGMETQVELPPALRQDAMVTINGRNVKP